MTAQWSVDEIDLSAREFWDRPLAEREAAFATLRRERPVARFDAPDWFTPEPGEPDAPVDMEPAGGYWALTRYAEVVEASRRPETFCSGRGAVSIIDLPPEMVEYFAGMISTDNPRHARLRRIVSQAFSPRRIRAIEDHIEQVTARVVDRVAPLGECDFVAEVAAPVPLEVICRMMGVPPERDHEVLRCSNVILSNGDPEFVAPGTHPVSAFLDAGAQLTSLMEDLAAERAVHPTDDLTSALVRANVDGEALSHAELASFFILLLTAGNETTRNAIAHGLVALTEHPAERAAWQGDPDAVTATAVDEIVRWSSPVIWMRRTVTAPVTLSGQAMAPGDRVLLFYNSANRDEAVFAEPQRFDVRRDPNPHVGFGAPGPHVCLGAHLARREIAAVFRRLFERLGDIEASGPADRLRSDFVNGIKHLPCRFTPG
jgi:cytochrome P450